jgi:hypothetical protein
MKYSEPVSELFSLDYPEDDNVIDYKSLGITTDHINDLMRLATDADLLNSADDDDDSKFWAAVHSWRALGQLQVIEIIPMLLELVEQGYEFDILFGEEYPRVVKLLGFPAVNVLKEYIFDSSKYEWGRAYGIECLKGLGEGYREECVAVLSDFITKPSLPNLVGLAISVLIDLNAKECIGSIRNAFDSGYVDVNITGDIEDVEIDLGIREKRSTPRPFYNALDGEMLPQVRLDSKIGRNDPCPCGSGKKFKKCCLH